MNFLSHIFLSGEDPDIQVGNFIGDFVKGKRFDLYSGKLRKGILLHRKIDEHFDEIDMVRKMRRDLTANYGRYSGVAVDLIFDYFLASKFCDFSEKDLKNYSSAFYCNLNNHLIHFETPVRFVSEKMIEFDWLNHYQTMLGMKQIAVSLERRIGRPIGFNSLDSVIEANFPFFESAFNNSFSQMQEFSLKSRLKL